MSLTHYKHVWNNYPDVKGSHKLILLALAEFANDDDECWPSISRLADMTGLKERQVQNLLRDLKEDGYIEIIVNPGRKNTNTYKFTMTEKVQSTAPFNEEKKVQSSTKKVQSATKKVQSSTEKGAIDCTRSIIEPIEKHNVSSATQTEHEKPLQPVGQTEKKLTPQQEYFSALCWVVGWDYKTITKEQSGQIAQTVGILQKAGYTKDDLRAFWSNVWAKDWRWTKKQQRPTVTDVRANIGKVKTTATPPAYVNGNAPLVKSVFAQDFTESEA